MRRTRLVTFLAGDPPEELPGAIDRRTFDLLGLRLPALATAALLLVSLLLILQHAHDFLPRFGPVDPRSLRNQSIERFVLFAIVPLGVLLALREDPRRYGLRLGDARRGLILLVVLSAVTLPALVLVARIPEIRDWYGSARSVRSALSSPSSRSRSPTSGSRTSRRFPRSAAGSFSGGSTGEPALSGTAPCTTC